VTLMGELTTNRLWDTEPKYCPSLYARMIPGTSAVPRPRVAWTTSAPTAGVTRTRPVNAIGGTATRRTQVRTLVQQLLPQPTGDHFMLLQLVAADLSVLVVVCGASSLFSPAWGLPWACLPIFAVLVTLFGFSEGLYKHAGDPSPAVMVPVLARSTLFAIALVFIAA
jgi:hypothetical protein